jgi:hypothetical protein
MESSVALANALHDAISAHPNKKPSDIEIKEALKAYQNVRRSRVLESSGSAGHLPVYKLTIIGSSTSCNDGFWLSLAWTSWACRLQRLVARRRY